VCIKIFIINYIDVSTLFGPTLIHKEKLKMSEIRTGYKKIEFKYNKTVMIK